MYYKNERDATQALREAEKKQQDARDDRKARCVEAQKQMFVSMTADLREKTVDMWAKDDLILALRGKPPIAGSFSADELLWEVRMGNVVYHRNVEVTK